MEYFILMVVLFIVLLAMKAISQGHEILQIIFFVAWVVFIWKFYPYAFSRSDKWRSSPVVVFINRIVVLVFAIYAFAYVMELK